MNDDKRFAVLIDADNTSYRYAELVFDELSKSGINTTYKRIYGDWTKPMLEPWKSVLLEQSITPIQQYAYTTGKNATDSAMIIDAMDILYTGKVEGFCLVSSDSDFTRLASRLRESGMEVIGMGKQQTPEPFRKACNQFKYLDVLAPKEIEEQTPAESEEESAHISITPLKTIKKAVSSIAEDVSDDDGWSPLSSVAQVLTKRYPDFDVRNYKHKKFSLFIRSLNLFEEKQMKKCIYIKRKLQSVSFSKQ